TANVPEGKKLTEGQTVKAKATVTGKTESKEGTATVGKAEEQTAPPTITEPKAGDKTISGTGVPGAKVSVTKEDKGGTGQGSPIAKDVLVGNDGKWTAEVPDGVNLEEGDTILATQKEDGKDESDQAQAKVKGKETPTPQKPSVTYPYTNIDKGDTKKVTPDIKDKDGKTTTPDTTPEVVQPGNGVIVTPNKDGSIDVTVPKDYDGPDTITVDITVKVDGKDIPTKLVIRVNNGGEVEIPGIKYKDHYIPTYPVYVSVPDKKEPVQDIFTHEQYIFGYPDDTIRPDGDMTRAEAIAVVARLQKLDLSDKTSNIYKDTKAGMWYNAAINAAFREGYLLEKEGENIRPNDKITRAELALLISHIDKKNDTVAPFEDVKGHKFEAAINQAYGNERIKGYPDGTFKPDNSITRAEVATMLNKLYDRYPDKNYIDANQNLVHNYKDMSYKGHWGYYELVEAYHTHKFARLANNMEEWKSIIK
ncbi:S-layer homology domain-containing protein, partial [Peptoniphilus vaginalis]|uniref:S-layer homology domain-containing protein n=1 Tax=Peptoniphilus vaginalis TaxID=1756987 RepID=UPI001FD641BC